MWALLSALRNGFSFLGWNITSLWRAVSKVIGVKWAVFILIIGVVYLLLEDGVGFMVEALSIMADIALTQLDLSIPPDLINAFQLANTIAPVIETIVFLAAYGVLLVVMTAYRHIKSMIPSPIPGGGGT